MFGLLLKKQLTEIFRGYFYNSKNNKKRFVGSTIGFFILYLFLMVGVVGGLFVYLSITLCKPMYTAKMSWLYFVIMALIAIVLGTLGSVFNTFQQLYISKDNDLLLSMPIPIRSIVLARLAGVYLLGFMYSAVVIVPSVIVYWVVADINSKVIIGPVLLTLLVSVVVLILSCVLGWGVAKISLKLKNKSFITVIFSLLFIGLYYFVYYKVEKILQELLTNLAVYGNEVKAKANILYLFGKIGEGYIPSMIGFTVTLVAVTVLVLAIISKSFIKIATSQGTVAKVRYKEKIIKEKSPFKALLEKEMKKFTSNANYMLNCGFGSIFVILFGGLILIKKELIFEIIDGFVQTTSSMDITICEGDVVIIFITVICALIALNDMVVPSVSLEGKSIWILQSLPVKPWNILKAKICVQLIITGIPMIFCQICMLLIMRASVIELILAMLIPIAFLVFITLFGMYLGIKRPNLTWTNEITPIKQSLSVAIAMFGGMAVPVVMCTIYLVIAKPIGSVVYMCLVLALMLAGSVIFYMWLKKKGSELFAKL